MKTFRNLHDKICSFANLYLASRLAQRGKRTNPEVFRFNQGLEENLLLLQRELKTLRWKPGKYRDFIVHESKPRLISAAPYCDRVVHHALMNIVEPLFDKTFIDDSYACRKGKGTHAAADRYTEFSRKTKYILKCDISKYFPSVRHDILFETLARKIADDNVLRLFELVIRSKGDSGGIWPSGQGIPIGNLTSQFFANVYLNEFDHWMKEKKKCRYYIRYVDDFVVFSNDKQELHSLLPEIVGKFREIGLNLHSRKRRIGMVDEGCDFMGYRVWPAFRRIRPSIGYRFRRHFMELFEKWRFDQIAIEKLKSSLMSWIGHAKHADTYGLRRSIFSLKKFGNKGTSF